MARKKQRLGVVLAFPRRARRARSARLDELAAQMIEAEQALFVALRLAQAARARGQAAIQPPPKTSSSRKKTAA